MDPGTKNPLHPAAAALSKKFAACFTGVTSYQVSYVPSWDCFLFCQATACFIRAALGFTAVAVCFDGVLACLIRIIAYFAKATAHFTRLLHVLLGSLHILLGLLHVLLGLLHILLLLPTCLAGSRHALPESLLHQDFCTFF